MGLGSIKFHFIIYALKWIVIQRMKGQQTCKLQISAAFIIYLQSDCKSPFPNLTPEIVWIKMI